MRKATPRLNVSWWRSIKLIQRANSVSIHYSQ